MTLAHWLAQHEQSSFLAQRAALGSCDLSMTCRRRMAMVCLAGRARRGGRGSVCRRRGATESRSSGDQSSAEFSSRDYSLNSDQLQHVQVTLDIDSDILDWLKQPTELAARNQESCPVFMKSTPPLGPSTNRLDDDMPF
jgi:hypothetical protein